VKTRKANGYLWPSVLYFSTVSRLVQALVITYDKFFQTLVVKGVVWHLKPFLDPTNPPYSPDLAILD
jgi:hypothetical protein